MQTVAIVNEKGGTAKTTTAVNMSAALGELGLRVLLVDLDGQAASSRWLGVEEDSRLADAMIRGEGLEPLENVIPGVSLAPATGKLDSVAHELRPSQSGQLRKILRQVQHDYDFIVMDCPPGLSNRLIGNALLAATHVIVPVETSILALDGLKILLTTLEDMRDTFGHDVLLAGVLACRYDGRTRLSRLVLEELRRALPTKVFDTVIRENVRMRECPATGESILTFAPDCHAALDYRALAQELISRPEIWERPPSWNDEHRSAAPPRLDVKELRNKAAAGVRAAANKAGWRKSDGSDVPPPPAVPGPDAETPVPPVAPVTPAGGGWAEPVKIRPFEESMPGTPDPMFPDADPDIRTEPAYPAAGAPTEAFGATPASRHGGLRASLQLLVEAERRLALEDAQAALADEPRDDMPPPIEELPAAAVEPAEQAVATMPEPPVAEPEAPLDDGTPADKFPGLRAFLREIGQEDPAGRPRDAAIGSAVDSGTPERET